MQFINEYAFMSNAYPCKVHYQNKEYSSVLEAYDDIQKHYTGNDWQDERIAVLSLLTEDKFYRNPYLREMLRNTRDIEIVLEAGETFWGMDKGKGENIFGKILMKIRDYIQKEDGYPMKVIISGSRTFDNYQLLQEKMDYYLKDVDCPIIISGHAKGADILGEKYAIERGLCGETYPADWTKYGSQAGYIRNEQMAEVGDCLVAFWNGTSKGTEHMINTMKSLKKPVRIVRF